MDSTSQTVTVRPCCRPPEVDERLPDESLAEGERKTCVSECHKFKGQLMWLATRTRPDISTALGICASMMVRTLRAAAAHLVELQRYAWTTPRLATSTLYAIKYSGNGCSEDVPESHHGKVGSPRVRQERQSDAKQKSPTSRPVSISTLSPMPVSQQQVVGVRQEC